MEPKKSGKIINIASIAGIGGPSAFHPAYCATKGAVLAFTRSVAIEVAGGNIFVNAIAAGGILTPPMEAFLASQSRKRATPASNDPARTAGQAGRICLARRLPRLRRALSGRSDDQPERRHDPLTRQTRWKVQRAKSLAIIAASFPVIQPRVDRDGNPGERYGDEHATPRVQIRHQWQDCALRLRQRLLRHLNAGGADGLRPPPPFSVRLLREHLPCAAASQRRTPTPASGSALPSCEAGARCLLNFP